MWHLGRIVALAGVLTALGLAADAFAQPAQPAQVEQGAQIGSGAVKSQAPFQQYVFLGKCPNPTTCTLDFQTVPPASRLIITNTSCYISLDISTKPTEIAALQLLVNNTNDKILTASTLVPFFIGETDSNLFYSANHPISVFANAGQHFQAILVRTTPTTVFVFACHISGQLQKLG
jgi:hypothetical protein